MNEQEYHLLLYKLTRTVENNGLPNSLHNTDEILQRDSYRGKAALHNILIDWDY